MMKSVREGDIQRIEECVILEAVIPRSSRERAEDLDFEQIFNTPTPTIWIFVHGDSY